VEIAPETEGYEPSNGEEVKRINSAFSMSRFKYIKIKIKIHEFFL